jgi:hypothetical protein
VTEAEWLASANARMMLKFLGPRASGRYTRRKARLFMCACCRRVWGLTPPGPGRAAVEVAERLADGLVGQAERKAASAPVWAAMSARAKKTGSWLGAWELVAAVRALLPCREVDDLPDRAAEAASYAAAQATGKRLWAFDLTHEQAAAQGYEWCREKEAWVPRERLAEMAEQAALLRDIIGNPFRPQPDVTATRIDGDRGRILDLAQAAYDERSLPAGTLDPPRLFSLADALEDAGCDRPDLLGHLRGPGPHVRGCWAVDLLLGKS